MNSRIWYQNYCNKGIIDVKSKLTAEDMKIIEKFGVNIKDGLYTGIEYDKLSDNLGMCYAEDPNEENLRYVKPSSYGISEEEFDKLYDKFCGIDDKFEELLKKALFEDENLIKNINLSEEFKEKLIKKLDKYANSF